jgi:hypothetical protein
VSDLKTPPYAVLRNEHQLGSRVIGRAAAQLAASFNPNHIAAAIGAALEGPARLCRLIILYIIWESHPGQPCAKPAGAAAGFTVRSGRRPRHEPEIVTSIAICRAIPVPGK